MASPPLSAPHAGGYVELHCHSAYSLLDGASSPEELVARAAELGHDALALTDHDSLAGAMEFSLAAHAHGLKPIHGCELTLCRERGPPDAPAHHITLLVAEQAGWRNMCRLITLAHSRSREQHRRVAVTHQELAEHAEGLICLSGCAHHGVHDEPGLRALREDFGADRLYVELQRPYEQGDRARNRALTGAARQLGLRCVATGNVHAHSLDRAKLQDAFVAIRQRRALEACEADRRANHTHALARVDAMARRFADTPDAVAQTRRIAEQITFDVQDGLGYRYPGASDPRALARLAGVCHAALDARYPPGHLHRAAAAARLEQELRLIDELSLAGFFLLNHEILTIAEAIAGELRSPALVSSGLPPGRGRGSSVSSIVCYLSGLSHVDPIAQHLALGRFLHEGLRSLPDIDLDFPRRLRARLIPAIHEHFGHERSALIATFPAFRARGAIRELGKALALPAGDIERLARHVDHHTGPDDLVQHVREVVGDQVARGERWQWLVRLAGEAQGLPRHISQHPGGMVISSGALIDCCPIVPAAMDGRQLAQLDKEFAADAGLLKIDLLGLATLSAVERAAEAIAERQGAPVDLSRIPMSDPATYRRIRDAQTIGVFGLESRAQIAALRSTQPACFEDLVIQLALIRPGPIEGGAVRSYIERRRELLRDPDFEIPYSHQSLERALSHTLGTIVFQDQVLQVARDFAGFSTARAEGLRRAMSKTRSREAIERHHQAFLDGALRLHPDATLETAESVWRMIAGFAGYGFPQGHATAFAVLAYQCAWLSEHHPVELLAGLLDEQPLGFYTPDTLIREAQRRAITIQPPEVNASAARCTVSAAGEIRLGLAQIKGLRESEIRELIDAREHHGAFASLEEVAAHSPIGAAALERLAWSGACDRLAGVGPAARRRALWQLGQAAAARRAGSGVQLALELPLAVPPGLRALDDWQEMLVDYETLGVSLREHPLATLRHSLPAGILTSAQLEQAPPRRIVSVAGRVVIRQRPESAGGVLFLLLDDEHGHTNAIVPEALYRARRALLRDEPLLIVSGRVERYATTRGAVNLIARELRAIEPPGEHAGTLAALRRRGGQRRSRRAA